MNTQQEQTTKSQYRETLRKIIDLELSNLPLLMAGLEPKERAVLLCKLLPFVIEKEKPTETMAWDSD